MTEHPADDLTLALRLLRLLRRPATYSGLLVLRDGDFVLDEGPVLPGTSLDRSTATALFDAQVQILELPARSPTDLLAPLRDAVPRALGDTLRCLRDSRRGSDSGSLAPAIRRLLVRAGASSEEIDAGVPPGFVAWLECVAGDDRWRYADATPLPDTRSLPLDRTWVELSIIEADELFSLRQNRPLRRDEMAWRTEPTAWVLERISGPTIVLGDPGAGKTTLMRWIARRLVTASTGRAFMPLFVSLRRYADVLQANRTCSLVEHFTQCECDGDPATLEWLRGMRIGRGGDRILGLLDGWDEVPADLRDAVATAIEDFTARFPFTVVTSRNSGAPDRLGYQKIFALTELGSAGVEGLVRNWCDVAGCPQKADSVLADLDRHEDVGRMAKNPFLLTLICGLSIGGRDVTLPRSRAELYSRTLAVIRHGRRPFGAAQEQAIDAFALWLMSNAPGAPRYDFQPDEVALVTGDAALFERVLVPSRLVKQPYVREPHHNFLHATFQEFCAARALTRADQPLQAELLARGLSGAWREVFRFFAALQPSHSEAWWSLLRRAVAHLDRFGVLAAQLAVLVAETGAIDGGQELLRVDLRDVLWEHIVRSSSPGPLLEAHRRLDPADLVARIECERQRDGCSRKRQMELVRMLGKIPAPESSRALTTIALSRDTELAAVAWCAAAGVLGARERRLLREELHDPSLPLQRARPIIELLGNARDERAVELLVGPLSERGDLSLAIVRALRNIASEDAITALNRWLDCAPPAEVSPLLAALAQARSPLARDALVTHLIDRVDHDADDDALVTILDTFAELPLHRGTGIIRHLLAAHAGPNVRRAAAWALAEATEPAVVEALIAAVDRDPHPDVRGAALGALRTRVMPIHADWLQQKFITARETQTQADAVTALLLLAERSLDGADGYRLQSMAAQAIERSLATPSGDVALAAAMHGFAGGPKVADTLLATVRDPRASFEVQEFAILSLGRLGWRPAVDTMVSFIGDTTDSGNDETQPQLSGKSRRAQRAAEALALVDPARLVSLDSALAEDALAEEAHRRQWLVYGDTICERWPIAEGPRLMVRRTTGEVSFDKQLLDLSSALQVRLTRLAQSSGEWVTHLQIVRAFDTDYAVKDPAKHSERSRKSIEDLRRRLRDLGEPAAELARLIESDRKSGYRLVLDPSLVAVSDD